MYLHGYIAMLECFQKKHLQILLGTFGYRSNALQKEAFNLLCKRISLPDFNHPKYLKRIVEIYKYLIQNGYVSRNYDAQLSEIYNQLQELSID